MDGLSEVYAALRLQAGIYFSTCFRGDFAISLARERRSIRFHLVLEGECVVTVPDQNQVRLLEGDLILIPDGAPQILSSGDDLGAAEDLAQVMQRSPPVEGVLSLGEAGMPCRLLCGFLRFDAGLDHPVLGSLPPLIVYRNSAEHAAAGVTAALSLLRAEANESGPGRASILQRVVEILLLQATRLSFADRSPRTGGFSRALADPRLSKALQLIHARPEQEWTLDTLASAAAMSRSRFAERFTGAVGLTPFAYLTQWRMIKARELLGQPGLDMADVAERCGYRSVPAFGRRFAASFGIGPGEWRKRRLASLRGGPRARQNRETG